MFIIVPGRNRHVQILGTQKSKKKNIYIYHGAK